ncbi:hypothetical protein M3Y94_00182800 [Aphelenchoides besseyi]|nr:hypothetical protein M3Y94_00182800 [Aphelenchoides besseyi]KAI6236867.1 hypothetical protein M3Y95_00204200 [Aphelenchoides besseyi]
MTEVSVMDALQTKSQDEPKLLKEVQKNIDDLEKTHSTSEAEQKKFKEESEELEEKMAKASDNIHLLRFENNCEMKSLQIPRSRDLPQQYRDYLEKIKRLGDSNVQKDDKLHEHLMQLLNGFDFEGERYLTSNERLAELSESISVAVQESHQSDIELHEVQEKQSAIDRKMQANNTFAFVSLQIRKQSAEKSKETNRQIRKSSHRAYLRSIELSTLV